MKSYFCAAFIIFALCKQSLAAATDAAAPIQNARSDNPSNNSDHEARTIAQLTHILHHAIEGNYLHVRSVKDFLKIFKDKEKWMQLLNFHRTAQYAARAVNMESNKRELYGHAKNLALLFPLSHFIEVMAAPAFVAIGAANGLPSIVIASGGSLLSIIAVPGLDPLCILLLAAYPLKPVHKSIDFVRRNAEKSVRGIISFLKLDAFFSKAYTRQDRFHFIQEKLKSKNGLNHLFEVELTDLKEGSALSFFSKADGSKVLSLTRFQDSETNQFYLKSVWISQTTGSFVQNILSLLSWNSRSAVRELLKIKDSRQKIQSYESRFFVDQVNIQDGGVEVRYKGQAVNLKDPLRSRKLFKASPISRCQALFQKPFRKR